MCRGGSSAYRDVDDFQPKSTTNEIIRKHRSALYTSVDPSLRIRIRDIQSRDRYSVDLVRGLGDIPLDGFLVRVTEDGGHDGSLLSLKAEKC